MGLIREEHGKDYRLSKIASVKVCSNWIVVFIMLLPEQNFMLTMEVEPSLIQFARHLTLNKTA